jgi:hypothetical protein
MSVVDLHCFFLRLLLYTADGVIYFDSDYPEPGMAAGFDDDDDKIDPHFYGVIDHGYYGEYAFKAPLSDNIRGSSPVDPLGRFVV